MNRNWRLMFASLAVIGALAIAGCAEPQQAEEGDDGTTGGEDGVATGDDTTGGGPDVDVDPMEDEPAPDMDPGANEPAPDLDPGANEPAGV